MFQCGLRYESWETRVQIILDRFCKVLFPVTLASSYMRFDMSFHVAIMSVAPVTRQQSNIFRFSL